MPLMAKLQEWVGEGCGQASFTRSESWLRASVQLGLGEANQMGVSLLSELYGPSGGAFGEVSSMGMLPHGSGRGATFLAMGTA